MHCHLPRDEDCLWVFLPVVMRPLPKASALSHRIAARNLVARNKTRVLTLWLSAGRPAWACSPPPKIRHHAVWVHFQINDQASLEGLVFGFCITSQCSAGHSFWHRLHPQTGSPKDPRTRTIPSSHIMQHVFEIFGQSLAETHTRYP